MKKKVKILVQRLEGREKVLSQRGGNRVWGVGPKKKKGRKTAPEKVSHN